MKKLICFVLITMMLCVINVVNQANAEGLPESVQKQSRKDAVETETWKKFDQSGQVKFLQVEHTASASETGAGAKLDGSLGERLVEIKVDPAVEQNMVEWNLENKGPSAVWVVAVSQSDDAVPVKIEAEASATLKTTLTDGYCYLVVDSEGGGETTLSIKATCGETEAKTVRGKSMTIVWF
jgi:hypothetical protein